MVGPESRPSLIKAAAPHMHQVSCGAIHTGIFERLLGMRSVLVLLDIGESVDFPSGIILN